MKSGLFGKYDYGTAGNMEAYGTVCTINTCIMHLSMLIAFSFILSDVCILVGGFEFKI